MPALHIHLRWPDGTTQRVYSPSTIVRTHFVAGTIYPIADFVPLARRALLAASERVRAVHGMPCSLAAASLRGIESRAAAFTEGSVLLEKLEPEDGR